MRDEYGRYRSLKEISEMGPEWAKGCEQCKHGLVAAPERTGACALVSELLVQAIETRGAIFCTCRAGVALRSNLANRRQALLEEARKENRLATTHVEIEIAQWQIDKARAENTPTVHYEVG